MTEFWVSQAKHYCKFCNTWMADNKPSKQNHENSIKHKIAVDLFQKEKREKALHGARSERELKQQLEEIDKAAKEAIQSDRISNSGQFYQSTTSKLQNFRPPPPPPPTIQHTSSNYNASSLISFGCSLSINKNEEISTQTKDLREDSTGIYEIRGQTYLEGTIHQEKLREGVKCEIFIEAEDVWLAAVVSKRCEIAIPNTELTLKSFDVKYTRNIDNTSRSSSSSSSNNSISNISSADNADEPILKSNNGQQQQVTTSAAVITEETSVKADRLRILISKEEATQIKLQLQAQSQITDRSDGNSSNAIVNSAVTLAKPLGLLSIDANAGFGGGWQTVSVEVVDDEEEEEQSQEEIQIQAASASNIMNVSTTKYNTANTKDSSATENIMYSVDPYNTGMYKGRYVGSSSSSEKDSDESVTHKKQPSARKEEVAASLSLSKGVNVSFKKRKRPTTSATTTDTADTNITSATNNNSNAFNQSNNTKIVGDSINDGIIKAKYDNDDDNDNNSRHHNTGTDIVNDTSCTNKDKTSIGFKKTANNKNATNKSFRPTDLISYDD